MKVAITGVAGNLGRSVAWALAADPAVESILGLDLVAPSGRIPKLSYVQTDICNADCARLFEGLDVVFHLAFAVGARMGRSLRTAEAINVEGSRRVFVGARAAGVSKIVYASSVAAYGAHRDNPLPLTEDHPLRPNHDFYYSRHKGAVEELLDDFQGCTVIRLRPCVVLGHGIDNGLARNLAARILLTLGPHVPLDLVWIEDLAEAFRLALHHPESDVFNVCGGGPASLTELGRLSGTRVVRLPRWLVELAVRCLSWLRLAPPGQSEWLGEAARWPLVVSNQRARQRLGWQPRLDTRATYLRFRQERAGTPSVSPPVL